MDKRNIALTLEEAKELYKNGDNNMKSLILTTFTKDELTSSDWENIKTFEDACEYLGMPDTILDEIAALYLLDSENVVDHLTAIYKLDIIRKALNGDWTPKMNKGYMYFTYVKYYPFDIAKEKIKNNCSTLKENFIVDGKKYTLVGGDWYSYDSGMGHLKLLHGDVLPNWGLLCCKSHEIAEHMGKYFAKEIFEACYAQHIGAYEWCD